MKLIDADVLIKAIDDRIQTLHKSTTENSARIETFEAVKMLINTQATELDDNNIFVKMRSECASLTDGLCRGCTWNESAFICGAQTFASDILHKKVELIPESWSDNLIKELTDKYRGELTETNE